MRSLAYLFVLLFAVTFLGITVKRQNEVIQFQRALIREMYQDCR